MGNIEIATDTKDIGFLIWWDRYVKRYNASYGPEGITANSLAETVGGYHNTHREMLERAYQGGHLKRVQSTPYSKYSIGCTPLEDARAGVKDYRTWLASVAYRVIAGPPGRTSVTGVAEPPRPLRGWLRKRMGLPPPRRRWLREWAEERLGIPLFE